jgi:hypothetical protein
MLQMRAFRRILTLLHNFTMSSRTPHQRDLLLSFPGQTSGRQPSFHITSSHSLRSGAEPYAPPAAPLDHADVQAGLSALPDYVTHLTETQLGILIERLSDSRFCHLLEVSTICHLPLLPPIPFSCGAVR